MAQLLLSMPVLTAKEMPNDRPSKKRQARWFSVSVAVNGTVEPHCLNHGQYKGWWGIACHCGAQLLHVFTMEPTWRSRQCCDMLEREFGYRESSNSGSVWCPRCWPNPTTPHLQCHWVPSNQLVDVQPFVGGCALKVEAWTQTGQYTKTWLTTSSLVKVLPAKYKYEVGMKVWPRMPIVRTDPEEPQEGAGFVVRPDQTDKLRWFPLNHKDSWGRWGTNRCVCGPDVERFFFCKASDEEQIEKVYEEPMLLTYFDYYNGLDEWGLPAWCGAGFEPVIAGAASSSGDIIGLAHEEEEEEA